MNITRVLLEKILQVLFKFNKVKITKAILLYLYDGIICNFSDLYLLILQ